MQHTDHCVSRRSVADEVPHAHLLHGQPEGLDVGAMEARLDAPPDRQAVRPSAHVSARNSGCLWWHPASRERHRAEVALTLAEREEISRAVVAGQSIRTVAALLGRAASTVSREIKRNGGQECYRASQADQAAWDRGHRPKICKLTQNRTLACIVTEKLRRLWSPEQIAGWLKHTYPRESHRVSHETIYRSLFIQARGALKKELLQHLRRTRGMRRSRHYTQKTDSHGKIVGAVSISERPAAVEDRAVPGHWEGDLLFGGRSS